MRIHHDSLIFSATDLVNFLGCRHASFLDRRNIDEPALVAEDDPYLLLLAAEQGVMPQRLHVVLGDNSAVALLVSDFRYYFDIARQRLEAFIEHLPQMSVGQPCNHCGQCRWRDRCGAEWEETDHLSLVANITRSQMAKLDAAGVTTMSALARIAPRARIANLQPDTLERLRGQARLQAAKRADGENRYEFLDMVVGKGFGRLPRPSQGDLFFDMEGDPLFEGGLEYLFGFVHSDGGEPQFAAFWGHDRAQENPAFEEAVVFIPHPLLL